MQRVAKCEARQATNECSAAVGKALRMQWREAGDTGEKEGGGAEEESEEQRSRDRKYNCKTEERRNAETKEPR